MIAGNWKMNKTVPESLGLIHALLGKIKSDCAAEVVLIPPFTSLFSAAEALRGSSVQLGAQNLSHLVNGAVTGEVSGTMLISVGCKYVLVGHSERRTLFQENNILINQKLKTALAEGLHPILCVGESGEERDTGKTEETIGSQLEEGLDGLTPIEMRKMTIAYEPIWAIGTGVNAKPEQAQKVHEAIRKKLNSLYESEMIQEVRIIYGGSVTADNSSSLMAQPDVDGALVGGASLDADSFYAIISAIK